jgi:hypothetical protein
MTPAQDVQQRLEQAATLPEVLDAAYDAFERILSEIDLYNRGAGPFFAALVMAAPAAADGRNALAVAPSLPPPSWHGPEPADFVVGNIAADLAELSGRVAARLDEAGGVARAEADLVACRNAARWAREVHGLLAGSRP